MKHQGVRSSDATETEDKSFIRFKMDLGKTAILSPTGYDQFGEIYDISSTLQWTSSNEAITIDQIGIVVAVNVGTTEITAEAEVLSESITITAWDSSTPRIELYVSDAGNIDKPPL